MGRPYGSATWFFPVGDDIRQIIVDATKTHTLPSGGLWLHEIKHDGFRVIARKNGAQVRLYSRPGNDLTRAFR